MTDDNVQKPVGVNSNPTQAQAEALVRQVVAAAGLIVGAFGLAKWAGVLGVVANLAGPIVSVVFGLGGLAAIVWGQVHTRVEAKKLATIASDPRVPDAVAYIKE
jgi:hypothetical protein